MLEMISAIYKVVVIIIVVMIILYIFWENIKKVWYNNIVNILIKKPSKKASRNWGAKYELTKHKPKIWWGGYINL